MKNSIYSISIMISLLFIGLSCNEDILELSNPNRLSSYGFWKTESDALAGVNAVYNSLYDDGLYKRLYLWIMDVRADDFKNTSPWWITAVSVYQTSVDNMCYYKPYSQLYTAIWRANQVIENVPGIDMDEALKERIVGEAHFLRGLFYYNLVVMYKNVPLVTETPKETDDYFPNGAATQDQLWNQIIKDFKQARDGLWTKNDYTTSDIGRASKGAAAGMLAKAYMYVQKWDSAMVELENIIAEDYGHYELVSDYSDNFTEANELNAESLFEVQFDASLSGTEQNWDNEPNSSWTKTSGKARTYGPIAFGGFGDIAPTQWIFDEFRKEKTTTNELDPRFTESVYYYGSPATFYGKKWKEITGHFRVEAATGDTILIDSTSLYLRKYLNDRTLDDESEWRSGINERVLRYSDVLLMLGECLNELNRTSEAYAPIQVVRDRANLPNLQVTKPSMTKEEMRLQISHERALEFCFEGKRYADLLRWGWVNQDGGVHNPMIDTLIQHDPEFDNLVEGREYMAIPQKELDANPNLEQNPGWD